jgi:hypothetical protein
MAEDIQALKAQISELMEAQKQDRELITLLVRQAANGTPQVARNGRGGRHPAQHVLDTKTNKVYRTKAEAGMAVAPEFGLTIHNFVWYELVKGTKNKPAKCPDRFEVIDDEEYEARLAEQTKKEQTPPEPKTQPQTQGQKK